MTTAGVGMAAANGLADMDVDTGLLQQAWESEVDVESIQHSVFANSAKSFRATVSGSESARESVPMNKIIMDVTPTNTSVRKVTKAFLRSLASAGQYGTTSLISNEEQARLKYVSAFANDWKHGVALDAFGINFREGNKAYKISQAAKPLLAQWKGEDDDYYIQYALLEGRSPNLASAPISEDIPFNPNAYVLGLASASQPSPASDDDSGTTMENNVGVALKAVVSTSAHSTTSNLLNMAKHAKFTRYIPQFNIMGRWLYLYYASPEEVLYMRDPNNSGSPGDQYLEGQAINEIAKMIPGTSFIVGDVLVIENPRAPTVTVAGDSTSGYTLTTGYLKHGRTDGRTSGTTANVHFNVNFLIGATPSLMMYEPEKGHYERQLDEYGQYDNLGFIGARGYCRTDYNIDTNNDSTPTVQHEGSMVVLSQRA